ncbi:hypothetical protein [Streptococcus merionis]|uniref:hypothetical protein n=1 Tax=Streptococcus merionis TaxID=400065 RepID=UPI0026ECE97B|nr:hypothetical protein [Streptococcus merionis]
MKKSIVTLLATVTLAGVAAPVVVNANNLGTTYNNARQRITDYLAAVQALNAQKGVVAGIETNIKALEAQLASEQVAFDAARAVVVAFKNATTAEQQEALKKQYGKTYDEALATEEAANKAVQTTTAAIAEEKAKLNTEAGKLPALESEVARTESLLTPEEKAKADKGEVPAPEEKKEEAPKAETKSEEKKAEPAKAVKAAATKTASKALPKTSAAK